MKKELTDNEIEKTFIPQTPVKKKKKTSVKKKEVQKIETIVKQDFKRKQPLKTIVIPDKEKTPEIEYIIKEYSYFDLNYFHIGTKIRKLVYFFSYKHYEKWFNQTFNSIAIEEVWKMKDKEVKKEEVKTDEPESYTRAEQLRILGLVPENHLKPIDKDPLEDLYEDSFITKLSDKQLKYLQERMDKIRWLEQNGR